MPSALISPVCSPRRWRLPVLLVLLAWVAAAHADTPASASPGLHYAASAEIDTHNVAGLQLAFTHSPDLQGAELRSQPVAAEGLLAYCSGHGHVWVLDGATGRLRWQATPPAAGPLASAPGAGVLPPVSVLPGQGCLGVAIQGGLLYLATLDGRVLTWTAATGLLRWETRVLPRDGSRGVLQGPPLVAGDVVIVGSSIAQPGQRGLLAGLDARTGRELWRSDVLAPEGAVWPVSPAGSVPASAGSRHPAEAVGGGGVGSTGVFDGEHQRVYWGTGSPLPLFDWVGANFMTHGAHPGLNPFTGGLLALDPQTGALRGWHQEVPHETWVRDSAGNPPLLLQRAGQAYVVHANRSGLVFVYTADLHLVRVWQLVRNFTLAGAVDPQTGELRRRLDYNAGAQRGVCPAIDGALPGGAGAYSPQIGLWYAAVSEWCMDVQIDQSPPADPALRERALLGGRMAWTAPPDGRPRGHLDARDPLTGAKVWTLEFPEPPMANLLATGGRLLFVADARGMLQALDAGTGRTLWRHADGDGHAGGLISYEAGGHQYIAVTSGWDNALHPAYTALFGGPFTTARTPHARLSVYRLP